MAHQQSTEAVNVYGVPQPSGFYSIIQIFRPGVTVSLSSATAAGATSFALSDASAITAGDLLVFDIGQNADYLTVSTVSGSTITTTTAAQNAHAASSQVFRPGPFTKTPGTPALLLDIEADADQSNTTSGASRGVYEAEWGWMVQGGLDQAAFYLHKKYEDAVDIVFGNYIVFGCQGGTLASAASAGASSISVTNLYANTNLTTGKNLLTITAGEPFLISDGTNTELFIASSVTGNGPWTINLSAAPGAGNSTLLNSYGTNAKIARLRYQGIIQNRVRNTEKTNLFQINAISFFNRYGNVTGNSTASQDDGAGLLSTILNSYKQTLPEIIVNSSNLAATSIPVTVTEQDARISQIIADILQQEASMVPSQSNNGLSITPTALDFPTVTPVTQEAKVNGGTAPYTVSTSDSTIATASLIGSDAVNTTTLSAASAAGATSFSIGTTTKTIGNTSTTSATGSLAAGDLLLFDGGTPQAEFLIVASVSGSTVTTTTAAAYPHQGGCTVVQYLRVIVSAKGNGTATITVTDSGSLTVTLSVAVASTLKSSAGTLWACWIDELRQVHHATIPTAGTPTYTMDLNTGSVNGDILGRLETTDMDGSNLMNAAIVRGGQDSTGNRIRISVLETVSQQMLNAWYEGVLDNSDITDEKALANWAASQLAILAYPIITAQLELTNASMRLTTADLLQITGFDDGSTLLANPVGIKYHVIAAEQRVTAQISLGVLAPDQDQVSREYANEKAIRETYNTPNTNLTQTYVVNGFAFTETGGDNFTIGTGNIVYQGVEYPVTSAYSGTAPVGDSMYGVQVVNGVASIVAMPVLRALGGKYATSQYTIGYRGGPATFVAGGANFIPLYKVTASSTAILNEVYIGPSGGVNPSNLATGTYAAPSVTGVTETIEASSSAVCDVRVSGTFGNIPSAPATKIRWYARLNGSSSWSFWGDTPLATSAFKFAGLVNGANYDFACAYAGTRADDIGPLVAVATNITASPLSLPTTALGDYSGAPTISSNSISSRNIAKGMLQLITVTFTESDFGSASPFTKPGNLDRIEMVVDVEGDTSDTLVFPINPSAPSSFTASTATYSRAIRVPAGSSISVGVRYVGANGKPSATTALSNAQNIADPNGDYFDTTDANGGATYNRTFKGVRSTHSSSAGDDGSYLLSSIIGRRHLFSGAGGNMLYNPKFGGGSGGSLSGWNVYTSGTACTWSYSGYNGGSLNAGYSGGATLGTNLRQQVVGGSNGDSRQPIYPNETYTFSALITTQNAGRGWLQVQTVQGGIQYNSTIVGTNQSAQLVSVTFTTGASDTQVEVKLCMDNNGTTGAAQVYFFDPKLEQGNLATPFDANFHVGLVALTHDGSGKIDVSRAQAGKLLAIGNMDAAVTNTIGPSAGSDGSYLTDGTVGNRHVLGTSIAGSQVLPACYSTQLTNTSGNGTTWSNAQDGGSLIAAGTTLTNGQSIYYNTGSANYGYPPAANPRQTQYNCPGSGSVTCVFKHVAFASGGNGQPRIYFTGTVSGGGAATSQTAPVSGSQSVFWGGTGTSDGSGGYTAPYHWSTTSGTPQTFQVNTQIAVSASNPLTLNLSSISLPSDNDGSTTLTITLKNPSGATVLNVTGITGTSGTWTYNASDASGTYTWSVQAVAQNNQRTADIPYSSSYTASFSGTASYWQNGTSSTQTYVLAADGSTQRVNVLDGNVQYSRLSPDTIAVVVRNSATSALGFSIGVDVTGL